MAETVINQESIAKELNISVGTVSKALRDYPEISSKTRTKVVELANKLGYRPYLSNFNSQSQKTEAKFVGVLVRTPASDWAQNEYLFGMSEVSSELNISQVVHHYTSKNSSNVLVPDLQPPALRDGMISGLIFIHRWPKYIVEKLNAKYPCVSIMHDYTDIGVPYIGLDNANAVSMLYDKLYSLGHRRVGFFGRCKDLSWSISRFGGYCMAIASNGVELRNSDIIDVPVDLLEDKSINWDSTVDFDHISDMIKSGISAWMCSTEWAGYNLYSNLKKRGFKIPRDVSITGFDNAETTHLGCPPLTSIKANSAKTGERALRVLSDLIEKKQTECLKIERQCEYVEGTSIATIRITH